MAENQSGLGRIYSMKEAAGRLGISRRALQDLVRRHPHYALNGNRKLFSEPDLARLFEAMRENVPKPSFPVFASPSPAQTRKALLLLTNKRRRRT